ncbi:MAG: S-layer homology domain-containing protein [Clostridiales bacterium]|nr:S-layer homology domain-containing protein [Clostridiales bacterium]
MMAAFLIVGLILGSGPPAWAGFKDVPPGAPYAADVNVLETLGIAKGYPDGTFGVGKPMTRQEFAVFLMRTLGYEPVAEGVQDPPKPFADQNQIGSWAKGAVNLAVALGIISGYPDGTFRPQGTVTRAEAMAMLVRALGFKKWAEGLGEWPKGYVEAAKTLGLLQGITGPVSDLIPRQEIATGLVNMLYATRLADDKGNPRTDTSDPDVQKSALIRYTWRQAYQRGGMLVPEPLPAVVRATWSMAGDWVPVVKTGPMPLGLYRPFAMKVQNQIQEWSGAATVEIWDGQGNLYVGNPGSYIQGNRLLVDITWPTGTLWAFIRDGGKLLAGPLSWSREAVRGTLKAHYDWEYSSDRGYVYQVFDVVDNQGKPVPFGTIKGVKEWNPAGEERVAYLTPNPKALGDTILFFNVASGKGGHIHLLTFTSGPPMMFTLDWPWDVKEASWEATGETRQMSGVTYDLYGLKDSQGNTIDISKAVVEFWRPGSVMGWEKVRSPEAGLLVEQTVPAGDYGTVIRMDDGTIYTAILRIQK